MKSLWFNNIKTVPTTLDAKKRSFSHWRIPQKTPKVTVVGLSFVIHHVRGLFYDLLTSSTNNMLTHMSLQSLKHIFLYTIALPS